MELPFKLPKRHKYFTILNWKNRGLIYDDLDSLYDEYIYLKNCDLCGIEFKSSNDRQMEHSHETGEFRNFVCQSCNRKKSDVKIRTDNSSGYKGIGKHKDKNCKQGYNWRFRAMINGKHKTIKTMGDFDKLVEFAEQWKKDNNYYT